MKSSSWIRDRRLQLDALMRRDDWTGHDPFDLVNAPIFRWIPERAYHLLLVVSKGGARLPFRWLRPLLRVPRGLDPKTYACAYFGYALDRESASARRDADEMLNRLARLAGRSSEGAWWGYDFVWPTLSDGVNPRRASTIVPGAFAIMALAWDVVVCDRNRHRELLIDAVRYYARRHWKEGPGGARVGYFATSGHNTHNANLLGCLALTLGGIVGGNDQWLRMAGRGVSTSLAAVRDNGSIPYNDHQSGEWTDCFHHLYVAATLAALGELNPYVDASRINDVVAAMDGYYRRTFLRDGGVVNYYPGTPWPVDPHNYAATAIYEVMTGGESGTVRGAMMLNRVDQICWDARGGYYHHRVTRRLRDRRLFMRWGQAWSFAALSSVLFSDALRQGLDRFRELTERVETTA